MCDLRPPRAILFDIGDTVLREQSFNLRAGVEAVLSFANHTTTNPAHLVTELESEIARHYATNRDFSLAAWLRTRLDLNRLRVDDIEDVLWRSTVRLAPVPAISTCLTQLASNRLPIAAVSNASFSGRVISLELHGHGLAHFAFVLTSADLGHRKPSAAIFDRALALLGRDASNVWFVGDTWDEDVIGSHNAGLVPFWLSSDSPPGDSVVPANVVADWTAFLHLYQLAAASPSPDGVSNP